MIEDFVWSEALSVGNDTIDRQHHEIIARANALFAALRTADGVDGARTGVDGERASAEVEAAVGFLAEYVAFHFAEEERLMVRIAFPKVGEHRDEHLAFRRRLSLLHAQLDSESGSAAVVMATTGFVRALLEHIGRSDLALADHARFGGVPS